MKYISDIIFRSFVSGFIGFWMILDASLSCSGNRVSAGDVSRMTIRQLTDEGYSKLGGGDFEKALSIYKEAASLLPEKPKIDELISYVKALNNIGYIHLFYDNNPEKAYPYFLRAKKLAEEHEFYDLLGAIYDNIAKIYDDFGDADSAIDTYSMALRHAVADSTDVSGVIQVMIFNDMVACAMANDMIGKISGSLDIFEALPTYNIPMGQYSKTVCLGLRQLLNGDTPKSTSILNHATSMIDSSVDRQRYGTDHQLMLATIYHMRNLNDSALICIGKALDIATANNLVDKLPRINRAMGTVLKSQGMTDVANKWFLKAHEIDDSLHTAKSYAQIRTLEPVLDIDILTKEMKMAELRHKNRFSIIWILAGAFVIISVLMVTLLIRNRKLTGSYRHLASVYRESVRQAGAASRLRREYESSMLDLRDENDSLREKLCRFSEDKGEKTGQEGFADKKLQIPIKQEERLRLIGAVTDVMGQSPEVFNSDFSLDRLAEIIGAKPRYLSAIINESLGKSFSGLVAETRVRKACEMLLSPDFKKTMTVESVSDAVGYKSRTQFTAIFKKNTGLTPTQYMAASR